MFYFAEEPEPQTILDGRCFGQSERSRPGFNSLSPESRAGSFGDGVDGKFGNRDQV